jgi:hypothetical protein
MSGGWSGATTALQATAVEPSEVAARVVEAVREERFWILTHDNALQRVASRIDPILKGSNPRIELGTPAEEAE